MVRIAFGFSNMNTLLTDGIIIVDNVFPVFCKFKSALLLTIVG